MSDYDIDWDMEDGLHVDHDGGVDLLPSDQQFAEHHDAFDAGGQGGEHATLDGEPLGDYTDEQPGFGDVSDESQYVDEADLPDFTLDPSFSDGSYEMLGADPDEEDLWSQLMLDMNDDVNPYATN